MNKGLLKKLLLYALVGMVALALKQHYSVAGAVQLRWILAPTTRIVSALADMEFVFNPASGYVALDSAILIAPGCAGLNFMIICFTMLAFTLVRHTKTFSGGLTAIGGAVCAALFMTIMVNACRILLSMHTFSSAASGALLSPERLHRLEGICIYFLGLTFAHYIVRKYLGSDRKRPVMANAGCSYNPSFFVPLFWYLMVMLGVPILRGSFSNDISAFIEHTLFVTLIPCLLLLAVGGMKRICTHFTVASLKTQ